MATETPGARSVVLFDVNGTLLDLAPLRRAFLERAPAVDVDLWFSRTLLGAMAGTLSGRYQSFESHGTAALVMLARSAGVDIDAGEAESLVGRLGALPAYPDVVPALEMLASGGLRIGALTNSSQSLLSEQMGFSGLGRHLERAISVEEVGEFKPSPHVYLHAAAAMGVGIDEVWLVAAHDWDVSGAIRAGARGAYVSRHGSAPGLLEEPADVSGPDLGSIAAEIVARVAENRGGHVSGSDRVS